MDRQKACTEGVEIFTQTFKYYKSKRPEPSLDRVLSLESDNRLTQIDSCDIKDDARSKYLGLRPLKDWRAYSLRNHPGLIIIKNTFTSLGQRYWIRKCLEIYPKNPNKRNIDMEMDIEDWWKECHNSEETDSKLLKKLRWTTLGYHHNWDIKVYSEENKGIFPDDLAELSDVVANYIGYKKFRSEAAIVNYYHIGSALSGHTDSSEVNSEAPLFSFSFGQSAIFLIGGRCKTTEPAPILLVSGDIVVMSKEARLCYHAVPKILPSPDKPWDYLDGLGEIVSDDEIGDVKFKYMHNDITTEFNKNVSDVEWSEFSSYANEARININVRQVLKENQCSLKDIL